MTYKEQYGSFTAADVAGRQITLYYAGSYFTPQTIEAGQVAAIEVGHPGKGEASQCYLRLKFISGESHRSAPSSTADCEAYRKQIEALLGR